MTKVIMTFFLTFTRIIHGLLNLTNFLQKLRAFEFAFFAARSALPCLNKQYGTANIARVLDVKLN